MAGVKNLAPWSTPSEMGGSGDAHNKGTYADETALQLITGVVGDYAIVLDTDTFWLWDVETAAWVNSEKSTGDMLLDTVQAVTAEKKFTKDKLTMLGTSTGKNIVSVANTGATDYTNTIPAKDGTFAMTDDIVSQVEDSVTDGHTTTAPSGNAVFDALALKAPLASPVFTGKPTINAVDTTGATYTPATGAQTVALDCATNDLHIVTGHADGTAITFTLANVTNNEPFVVIIRQGAVASTITAWFSGIQWVANTPPTLTASASVTDAFGFIRIGSGSYLGFVLGQNHSISA